MKNCSSKKLRVAIIFRVASRYRMPILKRVQESEEFDLCIMHGEDIPNTKFKNTSDFMGIPHVQLKTWFHSLSISGRSVQACFYPSIFQALCRYKPDVILAGGGNIFNHPLVMLYSKLRKIPLVLWSLGELPNRKHSGLGLVNRFLRDSYLKRADVLLGYSQRAKDYFLEIGCTSPIFVAVNVVDTQRVFEHIARVGDSYLDTQKELGIVGKQVILFVGAMTKAKQIDRLIYAYAQIKQDHENTVLLLVGDGTEKQNLMDLAAELKCKDVIFTGRVFDGVSRYFLCGDVFVLPGLGGLALSEAMCHSLPIICGVADGCEEHLVQSGRNGSILQTNTVEELTETIKGFLNDHENTREMGKESLRIIKEEHNVFGYVNNIEKTLRKAVDLRKW